MAISGTREWAVQNINCTRGCLNGCLYCYERARRGHPEDWTTLFPERHVEDEQRLYPGQVMFPTRHDIFQENLDDCLSTLFNLLGAGNQVLVVSKPRIIPMLQLFYHLADFQDHILFRFTIGCSDNDILRLWEPNAPPYEERVACLATAFSLGYKTSISMEPMLDPARVVGCTERLLRFVTDSIWLGKMNKVHERVRGVPAEQVRALEAAQSDHRVREIYLSLHHEPKVKWKESIKEIVGLPLAEQEGEDR
jgi:DNA repair photolyase